MIHKLLPISLVILLSSLVIGCGGGTSGTDGGGLTRIAGTLVDSSGSGISGAVVIVEQTGDATQTGQEGSFSLDTVVMDGQVTFLVEDGVSQASSTVYDLPPNPEKITVALQLDAPTNELSSEVVDVKPRRKTPTPKPTPTPTQGDIQIDQQTSPISLSIAIDQPGYTITPLNGSRALRTVSGSAPLSLDTNRAELGDGVWVQITPGRHLLIYIGSIGREVTSISLTLTPYVTVERGALLYKFDLADQIFSPPSAQQAKISIKPSLQNDGGIANYFLPSDGVLFRFEVLADSNLLTAPVSIKLKAPKPGAFYQSGGLFPFRYLVSPTATLGTKVQGVLYLGNRSGGFAFSSPAWLAPKSVTSVTLSAQIISESPDALSVKVDSVASG